MATCSVNPKMNKCSYTMVHLPHIHPRQQSDTLQEYLEQAGVCKNLHIVISLPVMRVLFKDEKSAAGDVVASCVKFGEKYMACAKREVTLYAG